MVKLIQLPIYKDKRKKNRIFTKKRKERKQSSFEYPQTQFGGWGHLKPRFGNSLSLQCSSPNRVKLKLNLNYNTLSNLPGHGYMHIPSKKPTKHTIVVLFIPSKLLTS